MRTTATFGLVRGYPKKREKYLYVLQILRNLSLKRISRIQRSEWDHIIFHEGNISTTDQRVIQVLSGGGLTFIDISADFKVPPGWSAELEGAPLGYALMCRFHSFQLWKRLASYTRVFRVDEDCFIWAAPEISSSKGFVTAALTEETLESTNRTLGGRLEEMGLSELYNQKFPYTNVYITDPGPWNSMEVSSFLSHLSAMEEGLKNRWGDIPILGIALNRFPALGPLTVSGEFSYFHTSHLTQVKLGKFDAASWVLDKRRPIKSLVGMVRSLRRP